MLAVLLISNECHFVFICLTPKVLPCNGKYLADTCVIILDVKSVFLTSNYTNVVR